MIKIEGIHKTYYTEATSLHVLKGIDLEITEGEYVSIMGASGSGKSTLLNIIGILDSYDKGNYFLNGKLIKNLSEKQAAAYRNEMIGFVFQPLVLPEDLRSEKLYCLPEIPVQKPYHLNQSHFLVHQ